MSETSARTLIACENCRRTKRKCAPPYPCHQCTKANVDCVVRGLARPKRFANPAPVARQWSAHDSQSSDESRQMSVNSGTSQHAASSRTSTQSSTQSVSLTAPDPCSLVRGLVISETRNSAGTRQLLLAQGIANAGQTCMRYAISRSLDRDQSC
jgi:hypothetical protein